MPDTRHSLPSASNNRDWSYNYEINSDPMALTDGTLTIWEYTGQRVRRVVQTSYGVQEQPPKFGRRHFLVLKLSHTGNEHTEAGRKGVASCGEVYGVTVQENSLAKSDCTCLGYARHKNCKHSIAICELVATGIIPTPLADVDREWDDFRESIESLPEPPEWLDEIQ